MLLSLARACRPGALSVLTEMLEASRIGVVVAIMPSARSCLVSEGMRAVVV